GLQLLNQPFEDELSGDIPPAGRNAGFYKLRPQTRGRFEVELEIMGNFGSGSALGSNRQFNRTEQQNRGNRALPQRPSVPILPGTVTGDLDRIMRLRETFASSKITGGSDHGYRITAPTPPCAENQSCPPGSV